MAGVGNALDLPELATGQIWLGNGTVIPGVAYPAPAAAFPVVAVTSATTVNMVSNTTYFIDITTNIQANLVLPTTSNVGDIINICSIINSSRPTNAYFWIVTYGTGQYIQVGDTKSTTTTGSLGAQASGAGLNNNSGSGISLLCVSANTVWINFNAPQGNLGLI